MFDWYKILPPKHNDYTGHKLSLYFLGVLGLVFTFRGCVHYFAPDGGSGIIAGIPLASYPEGAVQTIINAFGGFGIGHLLEAGAVWLVLFRYRALIPLVYVWVVASNVLAVVLLTVKPLPVVPPGQIAAYAMLPLTITFFLLSVRTPRAVRKRSEGTSGAQQHSPA